METGGDRSRLETNHTDSNAKKNSNKKQPAAADGKEPRQHPSTINTENNDNNNNQDDDETKSEWTPHQKLNAIVYLVMITVSIIILDQEYYNGAFSYWVYQNAFPREAATSLQQLLLKSAGIATSTPSSSSTEEL